MAGCRNTFRSEFKRKCFGFCISDHRSLLTFAWWPEQRRLPRFVFAVYRILICLYMAYWYIDLMRQPITGAFYFQMAYLTVWSYLLLCLYLFWAAIVAVMLLGMEWGYLRNLESSRFAAVSRVAQQPGEVEQAGTREKTVGHSVEEKEQVSNGSRVHSNGNTVLAMSYRESSVSAASAADTVTFGETEVEHRVPWYLGVQWFLHCISVVIAPLITLAYWAFLYGIFGETNVLDINMHGMNSVVMFLDLCLCATPVRLVHFLYVFVYSLVYLIFSVIFWGVDHSHVIYGEMLDWNNVGVTLLYLLGLTIALGFLQLIVFGISLLRNQLVKGCLRRSVSY